MQSHREPNGQEGSSLAPRLSRYQAQPFASRDIAARCNAHSNDTTTAKRGYFYRALTRGTTKSCAGHKGYARLGEQKTNTTGVPRMSAFWRGGSMLKAYRYKLEPIPTLCTGPHSRCLPRVV